ncbi:MAG TPA: glycoside hydrolase family 172 protein, partial [Tepidisphaeraceae bacterium]|nr:glycoside hydrolase family 172 protein [Tepidisphaeraceae bacterium]
RHCKITLESPTAATAAYDIEYRTYPSGTVVRSFSPAELASTKPMLDRVQKALLSPGETLPAHVKGTPAQRQQVPPQGTMAIDLEGPAAIRQMSIKIVAANAADLAQALRSTVLAIDCDGGQTVWCPIGDFFGSGVGLNPFQCWTSKVDKTGLMTCWWVMPFAHTCHVEVRNLGGQPVDVTLGPTFTGDWAWEVWSMYFHANWHQQYPIHTKPRDGTMDWNTISIKGAGVYVGDTLAVHNGARASWSEGDEKISVDGEAFPSHVGTGTADYYGISFGERSAFFDSPFHAQPRADGNNKPGFVTLTRNRALDAITFSRSLKFDMEIWHWAATDMAYAMTSYWYALPAATSNLAAEVEEAQRGVIFSP